jgi:hypothetical protein
VYALRFSLLLEAMMIMIFAFCLAPVVAGRVGIMKSPSREYRLCDVDPSDLDFITYRALIATDGTPDCTIAPPEAFVNIACSFKYRIAAYRAEYQEILHLQNEPWAPTPIETFIHQGSPCIVTNGYGLDLHSLRIKNDRMALPPAIIASIGIQIIDMLTKLHLVYNRSHGQLLAGNIALNASDSGQLMLVNYSKMTALTDPKMHAIRRKNIINDIKQTLLTLRYIHDGNVTFYSLTDDFRFEKSVVCSNGFDSLICTALEYVFTELEQNASIGKPQYNHIRDQLLVANREYRNRVEWGDNIVIARPQPLSYSLSAVSVATTTKVAETDLSVSIAFIIGLLTFIYTISGLKDIIVWM